MNIRKFMRLSMGALFLLSLHGITYSAEFFVSNNTKEIDVHTAYNRLKGSEQSDLQHSMIEIMQKNHIRQENVEDILGTYQMSNNKKITADNSVHFVTSFEQNLSDEKVFSVAKELTIKLNQDSVAVMIPSSSHMGDITVTFISHQPGINEVIHELHDKLPQRYSQAFSLHLVNKIVDFNHAKVTEIEWLGSKINQEEIKKAFPLEKIDFHYGTVFLIYKNGKKEQL